MKLQTLLLIPIVCFGLVLAAHAVVPAPDGGYPNFTTAEGDHALQALTLGLGNTAIGTFSMFSVTTGSFNTAVGAGSLDLNTADSNTATGAAALLFNTTGTENTANGTAALEFNDSGSENTAVGAFALFINTAPDNTAIGTRTLFNNTTGGANTAIGYLALSGNTVGSGNAAIGPFALQNNTTGNGNIALGGAAGSFLTTGDDNIDIGNNGVAGESGTIRLGNNDAHTAAYIGGIAGQVVGAGGTTCYVDNDGKLGVFLSSRRFKTDIADMGAASEALLALRPITFHYKPELDKTCTPQFGLVAEEVAKVNPDLVTRDAKGELTTVRYEAVNAMLLNEFLKEHLKVKEQQATIAELQSTVAQQQKGFESKMARQEKEIEALTAGLQKVSAKLAIANPSAGGLEVSKSASQT